MISVGHNNSLLTFPRVNLRTLTSDIRICSLLWRLNTYKTVLYIVMTYRNRRSTIEYSLSVHEGNMFTLQAFRRLRKLIWVYFLLRVSCNVYAWLRKLTTYLNLASVWSPQTAFLFTSCEGTQTHSSAALTCLFKINRTRSPNLKK